MQQFRNNTALFSFNIIRAGFELHMYHMRPGRGRSVFLQICNSILLILDLHQSQCYEVFRKYFPKRCM